MEYTELVKALRTAREARGMLQADLAQQLGITQGVISKYESGQISVPTPVLLKWGAILGLGVHLQPKPQEAA